jgi:hypothetical protein
LNRRSEPATVETAHIGPAGLSFFCAGKEVLPRKALGNAGADTKKKALGDCLRAF